MLNSMSADWYAYQCKSGEVLFYYNRSSGEHRWAIHFCSCLKANVSSSGSGACCVWEPSRSSSPESGKFVRSMGTQTDESKQDNGWNDNSQSLSLKTSAKNDKPYDLVLQPYNTVQTESHDVILDAEIMDTSETNSFYQSSHFTLKVNDALNSQLCSVDKDLTKPAENNRTVNMECASNVGVSCTTVEHGVNSATSMPYEKARNNVGDSCTSVKHGVNSATTMPYEEARNNVGDSCTTVELGANSATSMPFKEVRDQDLASLNDPNAYLPRSLHSNVTRKTNEGSSSRKNPEPRKLLRKSKVSETPESSSEHMLWETGPKDNLFGDSNEEESIFAARKETSAPLQIIPGIRERPVDEDAKRKVQSPVHFVCELCREDCGNPTNLTEHLMNHQPTGSKCPVCSRQFTRRTGLRFHVRTHSGDRPYPCHLCERAFTKSESLVAHIRTHSSERPYACTQCSKAFTHPGNLIVHTKSCHSDDRPFTCQICNKGFKTATHLSLHRRAHSDERPYTCTNCDKTFKNSSHLRNHMKHHKSTSTTYSCSKCDQGFKTLSLLSHHIQTHPLCFTEWNRSQANSLEFT